VFALAQGVAVSTAADYQDVNDNICEGPPCAAWAGSIGGFDNTAFGDETIRPTSNGDKNISIGRGSLSAVTSGESNIAIGADIAIGSSALKANTTGSNNQRTRPRG